MNTKGTIALLCAVLGVTLWLLFFEKDFQHAPDAPLLQFHPDNVTVITINDGNDSLLLERHPEGWTISTNPPDRGDSDEIARLLTLAAEVKPFDLLRAKELKKNLSLSSLGLQPPRRSLVIHQEGAPDQTLYFGSEAVGDKSLFACLNKKRPVFIIPSTLSDQAFRSHDDFRDHSLTHLDLSNIVQVQLRQGLGNLSLNYDHDQWKMTQPTEATINKNALKEWITPLLQAPILTRVANDDGDLSAYGLDRPRAEITLSEDKSTAPLQLSLGKAVDDKDPSKAPSVYIRSSERHAIFKVPATVEKIFMISPDDLRDHHLFSLNLDSVDRITFTKQGTSVSLRRQQGGGDGWVTTGSDTTFVLGSDLQKLVEVLGKTNVIDFVPATPDTLKKIGLEPLSNALASLQFTAHLSENTPDHDAGDYVVSEIFFGAPLNDSHSLLYARVNNAPDLSQVPVDTLEKLDLSLFKKITK